MGISPAMWLNHFGSAVNMGCSGDAEVPLPLSGPQGFCFRCGGGGVYVFSDGVGVVCPRRLGNMEKMGF